MSPWFLGPYPSHHLAQLMQTFLGGRVQRAASHQGKQGQGALLPAPWPFPPRGQQEVRRKGRDGRREGVGGKEWGLSNPQQTAQRAAAGARNLAGETLLR